MAIAMGHPFVLASASAAAITRLAVSSDNGGP
jgi:hypothetical protein